MNKHQNLIDLVSKGTMEQDNRDFSITAAVDSAKALLAVLELHKPFVRDDMTICNLGCNDEGGYLEPYPCRTIVDINWALNSSARERLS